MSKRLIPIPERCSLANAVMYLHDQTPIVAEGVYDRLPRSWPYRSAFDELPPDDPYIPDYEMNRLIDLDRETDHKLSNLVTPLLANLHNGSIKSWGSPSSDDIEEISHLLFEIVEIDPEAWVHGRINWEKSEIYEIQKYTAPHIERYFSITIDARRFFEIFGAEVEDSVSGQSRKGRKPLYDWDNFFCEIAVRADLDGLPATQAELEKEMASWCLSTWGKEPGESTLRSKISPIYDHLRRSKGQ